ncbi:MAG: L-serine ammonia-lyase, iron-sulfur-dependent, subunit alpha [Spirochaetales bacterium]|nr:L-serine ammonia-lyase, iron-sulfur-dependent, subunit alpha [Spirochaetales bacterium]
MKNPFLELLHREVVPALGCTEPIAISLAAAIAMKALDGEAERIEVKVSANILKNAMGVGIPGTGGSQGLDLAAALGALGGDSEAGLEVLRSLNDDLVEQARVFVKEGKVDISLAQVPDIIYIEVVIWGGSSYSQAIMQERHTNLTYLKANGKVILDKLTNATKESGAEDEIFETLSLKGIYEYVLSAPFEDIAFILEAAKLNRAASREGLNHKYGLEVGRTIKESMEKGILCGGLENLAAMESAAASDARMDGCTLPVMSNSGSGNQGITATLPVVVAAEMQGVDDEKLARALILSHLTAIHIKHYTGRLSALCGAIIAATGSSCAIVYLLGGGYKEMSYAIQNMVGDIAGMICDGAKNSCAMKISTAVKSAVQAALMGLRGMSVTGKQGIISDDVEQTIRNLGKLGTQGMGETDKVILDIMINKD